MSEDLRVQYESYPYPPRDPADEASRLIANRSKNIARSTVDASNPETAGDPPQASTSTGSPKAKHALRSSKRLLLTTMRGGGLVSVGVFAALCICPAPISNHGVN